MEKVRLESTVIDPVYHAGLIKDIDNVCMRAGISKQCLYTSSKGICSESEVDWVRAFRTNEYTSAGLCITGRQQDILKRFMALTAIYVRNFVDARMISLHKLRKSLEEDQIPDCSVLLIPNFMVGTDKVALTGWQASMIYDMVLDRISHDKKTILYVDSMAKLGLQYGDSFRELIEGNFDFLKSEDFVK